MAGGMHPFRSARLVLATAFSVCSCASFWSPETLTTRDGQTFRRPIWTTDGLYLANIDGPGALFLAPPPRDVFGYRSVYVEDIRIRTKRGHPKLDSAEQERIRAYVRRQAARSLERNDWAVVDGPGPGTLRLRVALDEIEFQHMPFRQDTSILNPSGGIEIALELCDSVEGHRVLLFASKRMLPFRTYSGAEHLAVKRIDWAFVEFMIDLDRRIGQMRRGRFPVPAQSAGD
jgi:Protein of unknown function (DUF3313)